jgi:outer membrane protein assembly factor BamE (lipoprotein component of BamABCDE complex)
MMDRRFRLQISCSLGLLVLAGCAPTVDQRGNLPEPAKLAEIKPGVTTKDAVSQLLGTPSTVSTFNDKTWYYISRRTEQVSFFNPELLDQQVVAVAFDDGGVVREVEHLSLADSRTVEPSTRVTPSAGRELGIFEQLIGNVGRFGSGAGDKTPGPFKHPGE